MSYDISLITSADKRTLLRKLLFDFQKRNAGYNTNEQQYVDSLLQVLQPVCQQFETYNAANSGREVLAFDTPRYPETALEIDMYGTIIKTEDS